MSTIPPNLLHMSLKVKSNISLVGSFRISIILMLNAIIHWFSFEDKQELD